jgi:hypothetical protein
MVTSFALYFLAAVLTCGLILSLASVQDDTGEAAQVPLYETPGPGQDEKPDNSNLILASLHSLLKSWQQAYTPHGHAVIPVTIKTGTLLYHMGGTRTPRYMNWFA